MLASQAKQLLCEASRIVELVVLAIAFTSEPQQRKNPTAKQDNGRWFRHEDETIFNLRACMFYDLSADVPDTGGY